MILPFLFYLIITINYHSNSLLWHMLFIGEKSKIMCKSIYLLCSHTSGRIETLVVTQRIFFCCSHFMAIMHLASVICLCVFICLVHPGRLCAPKGSVSYN